MIRKILIISFFVIAFIGLTGCSGSGISGILKTAPPSLTNQNADTDNIQEESLNGPDDSKEIGAAEADGEVEAIEPADEQGQEENLPNGGYQDQDNTEVDHQFEGIE
jgi:hypothetical protein